MASGLRGVEFRVTALSRVSAAKSPGNPSVRV